MESISLKNDKLHPIVMNFDMQTTFFKNALEGISAEDMRNRLDTKANHIAWLAGSLVEQRFEMVNAFVGGEQYQQQAHDLFKNNQGIKDGVTYPSIEQYIKDWERITPILRKQLSNADQEKLDTKIEMPGMSMTLYELLTFVLYREANHIGQIELWRRILGYEPMKYM